MTMRSLPPASGDEIDMDRIIVDPEYRRRVIARLRQDRLRHGGQDPAGRAAGTPERADGSD